MKNLTFIVLLMLIVCYGNIVQSQSDSSSMTSIDTAFKTAPVVTYNLPPVGATTGGQIFAEEKYIKSFGGTQAEFFGPINNWTLSFSYMSVVDNKNYYVYDCGRQLKKTQEICIDIGGMFMPQKALDKGEVLPDGSYVQNGKKDGNNYLLQPEDYGVVFTPK